MGEHRRHNAGLQTGQKLVERLLDVAIYAFAR